MKKTITLLLIVSLLLSLFSGFAAAAKAEEPGKSGNCEEGHTWNEGEVQAEATCEEAGSMLYTCTVCGETKEEEIPANGHACALVEETPATCTEDGNIAYLRCGSCGKLFSKEAYEETEELVELSAEDVVIPAAGHQFEDGECIICEEEDPDYVPPMPFDDVTDGAFYVDTVAWAVKNEITNGITETTFSPDSICTRAQVVTFLWRANGEPEPQSDECQFEDVSKDAFYYKAMLWAVESGITNGISEKQFAPNSFCSRGQIVTFLYRAYGAPEVTSRRPFRDVAPENFFCAPVIWAVENGITLGTTDVTFSPNDSCTRAQAVTFLYRGERPAALRLACMHDYKDGGRIEATCTAEGSAAYHCDGCGDSFTAVLPALGHKFNDAIIAPRTDREGYTEHTCDRCGYVYRDNYTDKEPIHEATLEDVIYVCNQVNAYIAEHYEICEGCPMDASSQFPDLPDYVHQGDWSTWFGLADLFTNNDWYMDNLISAMCRDVNFYATEYYEEVGMGRTLYCGYLDRRDNPRFSCAFEIVFYLGS